MVVTFLPPTVDIWVWQDLTALPSIWTVQAPHRPEPQPYLVGEFQMLAHDPKQGRVRLGLHAHRLAVDCKCDRRHGFPPWQTVHHTSGMFRLNGRMVVVFWIGRKARTRGAAAWRGFCSDRGRLWQTGDARSRTVYDDLAFARNVRKDR